MSTVQQSPAQSFSDKVCSMPFARSIISELCVKPFEDGRQAYNSEAYFCARCGQAEPSEKDGSDHDGQPFNSIPSTMSECENFDSGCGCLLHDDCAIEGLCPHCAASDSKQSRLEEETRLAQAVSCLAREIRSTQEEVAKETDPGKLQQIIEDAREVAILAAHLPALVYARMTALSSVPLPLSSAA